MNLQPCLCRFDRAFSRQISTGSYHEKKIIFRSPRFWGEEMRSNQAALPELIVLSVMRCPSNLRLALPFHSLSTPIRISDNTSILPYLYCTVQYLYCEKYVLKKIEFLLLDNSQAWRCVIQQSLSLDHAAGYKVIFGPVLAYNSWP